jgi:Kdo2-lipid IVA lauroyltransferase/acyltransferase
MLSRPLQRLMQATEATGLWQAVARLAAYLALRAWVVLIGCFPIEVNLATARFLGRCWWWLRKDHRARARDNLRPAFRGTHSEAQLTRIARASFEHFAQLYLVELAMTPRLITPYGWSRYVELGELGPTLRELLSQRGAVMLTAHFGNYELLGYTVCRLGLPITAVMRPLDNPLINNYLMASRAAGGLSLLFKRGATAQAGEVLDRGGALCFIADQDAGRKGLYVDFFGRKASTYKSIGLLAMAKRVPVVIGTAARVRSGFHYRMDVERIIQPEEWESQPDPLLWVTQTFSHALEAAIRRHPEQYLWVHRRWKHRPKSEQPTEVPVRAPASEHS